MTNQDVETFCPTSRKAWRQWLQKHHQHKTSIWLVYYKKKSDIPSITYNEAVDEALCFGWIDSTKRPMDEEKFMQFFCKRKPKSVWSKINKDKIERLTESGLMTEAGLASVAIAQQNGSWNILDEAESLVVPADLEAALEQQSGATAYFMSLSKSARKAILQWLLLAKRADTRQKRINEIAELAAQQLKPKQFR
jgi:uncharacterized protein YdeI (YjbR/CyaY-like superfamily)